MKKFLRIISLAVTILMFVSLLAGCGNETSTNGATTTTTQGTTTKPTTTGSTTVEEPENDVPAYLSDTSPVTFDWYVDESWYTRVKWGQDLTSQYITEKTGVSLNIIIPAGSNEEKKNIMIASGDIPDFVSMGHWHPHWRKMIDGDLLWSLDELAEKYDPDFYDATRESVLGWYRYNDGNTYVYPNANWPVEDITPEANIFTYMGFSVRKDMYEAIGKPDMTTPEGFLNGLTAAKEKFPTVRGQPMIPFSFGAEFTSEGNTTISDVLLHLLNIPVEDSNGQLYQRLTDPELVIWLKTFRKATELGLITTDVFIDKHPQIEEKMKSGRYFSTMLALNSLRTYNGLVYENDPDSVYIAIDTPMNSRKDAQKLKAGGIAGWLVTMISKKTEYPERAIKFMHYYLSEEGQTDFYYGDPSMRETVDGQLRLKPEIYNLRTENEAEFCRVYGGRDAYFMLLSSPFHNKSEQGERPSYVQQIIDWTKGKNADFSELSGIDPDPNTPEGIALAKSRAKWGELLPKMLLAKTDEELDTFMNEFKKVDDEARAVYLPVMQQKYEENKIKLNK